MNEPWHLQSHIFAARAVRYWGLKHIHGFLILCFLAGAAVTGFGHDAEMVGLGAFLLGLLAYALIPKRRQ
jgi:hypothetical protein